MKTPADRTIVFTYMALPLVPRAHRWAATVTFPPGAGPDDALEVAVTADRRPLDSGSLEIAGQRVRIRGGTGFIAYADFVRGKHDPALCLHRRGRAPAPGTLTFA